MTQNVYFLMVTASNKVKFEMSVVLWQKLFRLKLVEVVGAIFLLGREGETERSVKEFILL